jgi:hypothetical protein
MKIVAPKLYMRPGALRRSVLLADRGVAVRRVIPVPILVALDEAHLAKDAHLMYGVQFESGPSAERGFVARACAYAALMMSPSQQAYLYEHVMSLEDIVRYGRGPVPQFEIDRAELFDHVQGGNRAELLGVKVFHDKVLQFEFDPLQDHA